MSASHRMTRAAAAVGGLLVFALAVYAAAEWEIGRELAARGYDRSSVYWDRARGISLAWGGVVALPGLGAYAAIVLWAWRQPPRLSARRLLALQGAALVLTLLALRVLGAIGVLVGAPAAGLLAFAAARRGATEESVPPAV